MAYTRGAFMADISVELLDSVHAAGACMVDVRELGGKLAHLSAAEIEPLLLRFGDDGDDRATSKVSMLSLEENMKLYTTSASPNGRRTNIAIAEKGIEIEKQEIDLAGAEYLSDDFKTKNPFGRVPVLELDDGTCIAEKKRNSYD